MSDITLTSGIRSNLLALQTTSNDLTSTQEALATGKKVNSAADNPSSYFTSQNLTQSANNISALLDQIGQGSQTIQQATNGLTSLTGLLQQALSTVQQAQSSNWTTAASATGTVKLGAAVAGSTTGTSSVGTLGSADCLVIDLTNVAGVVSSYIIGLGSGDSLSSIESTISTATSGALTATDDGAGHLILNTGSGTSSFTVDSADSTFGLSTGTFSATINTTGATGIGAGSLLIDVGSSTYTVSVSASSSLATIEADINSTTGLGSAGTVTATDDGSGHLVLTSNNAPIGFTVDANATSAALGLTTSSTANNVAIGSSSTRSTLQGNFNTLLTQITQLASDANYNGVNLLAGDSLTIDFNSTGTSSLSITGVTFNAEGLGLSAANGSGTASFQSDSQLSGLVSSINTALSSVQTQAETFGTNASTINTRQGFENALINTLQTGAANLVVADQNVESANLLTEQTQQQLEISALSIANQANQSVLKLFG